MSSTSKPSDGPMTEAERFERIAEVWQDRVSAIGRVLADPDTPVVPSGMSSREAAAHGAQVLERMIRQLTFQASFLRGLGGLPPL